MYPAVKEVIADSNFMLLLTFDNGDRRKFDMKPYLEKGIFRELKDIAAFNNVHVCFDSIEWDNEADLDPEVLYNNSVQL